MGVAKLDAGGAPTLDGHMDAATGRRGDDLAVGRHTPAEIDILEWWQTFFELPCVAIGGITPDNCAPLVAAGADFLAVCGAVWNGDEAAAVQAFHKAISSA